MRRFIGAPAPAPGHGCARGVDRTIRKQSRRGSRVQKPPPAAIYTTVGVGLFPREEGSVVPEDRHCVNMHGCCDQGWRRNGSKLTQEAGLGGRGLTYPSPKKTPVSGVSTPFPCPPARLPGPPSPGACGLPSGP